MQYKREEKETVVYTFKDILDWVKMFGSKQLGITPDEIPDEEISVIPIDITEMSITIIHTKTTSNIKKEDSIT